MTQIHNQAAILVEPDELKKRLARVAAVANGSADALLISDAANLFYLTGRVFDGWAYIPLTPDAEPRITLFVKRQSEWLTGDYIVKVHKPEQMAESIGLNAPQRLGLELDLTPWSMVERLKKVFPGSEIVNASPIMRQVRAVKTPLQIELIARNGVDQARVYRRVPKLYTPGMSDVELQIEIERALRLEGCLGIFRISGSSMELYMGNLLAGENADVPSPYDFAMGGGGQNPSLPGGADGTILRPGMAVMVDMNGNFNGYMTDMTRVYCVGNEPLKPLALRAHQCSRDIHRALIDMARPGVKAADLYHHAEQMVRQAKLEDYFMGHRQKAGFIGHGIGIEVNELPVIAPRSRDILQAGNVIALEPKFVIPGVGAVGVENTYEVRADGPLRCLTSECTEDIITLPE